MKGFFKVVSVILILVFGVLFLYELYPVLGQSAREYSAYKWLGIGSMVVMPSDHATTEPAADPRPGPTATSCVLA